MQMQRKLSQISILLTLWLMFYQPMTLRLAEAQEDGQRDIESTEVTRNRRPSKKPQPRRSYHYRVKPPATANRPAKAENGKQRTTKSSRTPKSTTESTMQQFPVGPPPKGETYMTLGVTLWRVRPATEAESKDPKVSKEQMTWEQQEHQVVVSRMSDETPISDQELVQMSIEYLPERDGTGAMPSNHASYLYVINRERFPDGSLKNARLIFPTRLTYRGDNRLLPGQTVTLPDPQRPFRINRSVSEKPQSSEDYIIILSPVPLDAELPQKLDKKAMNLSPKLVAKWEQQWPEGAVQADLLEGVGQARTQRELDSSGDIGEERGTVDPDEELTQDDVPPQTVFRSVVKPGTMMLLTISLPFKENTAKP